MTGKTTWIIGSDPASDLVVDRSSVSWRHCRLSLRLDGTYTLEDLGSTNGTFVNGRRVQGVTPVRRQDTITLGQLQPIPWPAEPLPGPVAVPPAPIATQVIRIGREPDNDVVIDGPEVSAHHARVQIAPGGLEGVIEDLGSTNGTALGAVSNRVQKAAIKPGDILYFGPVAYPASALFPSQSAEITGAIPALVVDSALMTVGRDSACDRVIDFPMISNRHARFVRAGAVLLLEDLHSSNGTFVNGKRIEASTAVRPGDLIGLGSYVLRLVDPLAPADPGGATTDLIALHPQSAPSPSTTSLIAVRSQITLTQPLMVATAIGLGAQAGLLAEFIVLGAGGSSPAADFGLCLAAVWIGLTSALFDQHLAPRGAENLAGHESLLPELTRSLGRPALLDLILCGVLLGIVSARASFDGRWPAAFGVVWLTSLIGSALGLALVRLSGRIVYGLVAALALTMFMALIGGPARPLPVLTPVARLTAMMLPTRWAFEALLLLSEGARADVDLIEPFFPAETDRAGTAACATALVAMLGGLVYIDALIVLSRDGSTIRRGSLSP
jgi:pSer/pThr/pTyr-binding forkhead associated (FHA) protein